MYNTYITSYISGLKSIRIPSNTPAARQDQREDGTSHGERPELRWLSWERFPHHPGWVKTYEMTMA